MVAMSYLDEGIVTSVHGVADVQSFVVERRLVSY